MTKQEAQTILGGFYTDRICKQIDAGLSPWLNLPLVDEVVYTKTQVIKEQTIHEQWTFKGLIKLAYDL